MKNIDIFEIVPEIYTLVWTKYAKRQCKYGPEMNNIVMPAIMMGKLMDLGMTVMASGNAIGGAAGLNLFVFYSAIFQSLILEARLEKSAAAAAAVII